MCDNTVHYTQKTYYIRRDGAQRRQAEPEGKTNSFHLSSRNGASTDSGCDCLENPGLLTHRIAYPDTTHAEPERRTNSFEKHLTPMS